MDKTFLTLCSPPDAEATASANLSDWKGYKNHRSVSLLLEAINQFAVRYATSLYPCTSTQRYLPAMVEYFTSAMDLAGEQLVLEGDIEMQHHSMRIVCRAWSDNSRHRLVADAAIVVHPVQLPEKVTPTTTEDLMIPLWEILTQNSEHCDFRLNGSNPLFSEHFPGNPVCPGSLLIDLLLSTLLQPFEQRMLKLKKVKFIRPVRPEQVYRLTFASASGKQMNNFLIIADNGERHVSGSYSLS
ncbi:hypothetical protein JK229_21325 [Pantoea dispersa]|uniref:hypothetical protein n=1 Tax=Pantoea dispersa TaxID=59814 RepID=UPI001BA7B21B|nr:hypothetical protein [Pantoea dispersa]MBS0899814.1 hypothetical protein [Pantoea dispersa]MBS0907646.1 hypothetical protein [Pantoea dispersa]